MSAETSAVKPMRGVRNESSLLFSMNDFAASQPASTAAGEARQEGSGLLDLEGLTQNYLESRNAGLGMSAELPDALVVAAWPQHRPAHLGITGIVLATMTGAASAALILIATWIWIVPHAVGARPLARRAAAPASASPMREAPEPPAPRTAALAAPAASQGSGDVTAPAVPAAAPAPVSEPAGTAPIASTQRPARTPATSRPRQRTEATREQGAASNPAGAAECLDEVACLLASDPPACCARPQSSQGGKPQASSGDDDAALPDKLERAAIQAGITQVRDSVAACQRHGTGTVSLSVRVNGDGRVSAVDVKSAPNQALGSCAAQAVENARFARSRSGQRFVYPFVF